MPHHASGAELSDLAGLPVCVAAVFGGGCRSAAADHYGQVTFGGLPVPGATVTASQGDKQFVTSTDQQGVYKLADLAEGRGRFGSRCLASRPSARTSTSRRTRPRRCGSSSSGPSRRSRARFRRALSSRRRAEPRPAEAGCRHAGHDDRARTTTGGSTRPTRLATKRPATRRRRAVARQPDTATGTQRGFQRAGVNASNAAAGRGQRAGTAAETRPPQIRHSAPPTGFLINGSVNNGAASPFAQLAAFGNNRRGGRSLYTGGAAVILGNSTWDARPFSFTSEDTAKPDYTDVQVAGQFGGPLKIPGLLKNASNVFVGYQRTSDHNAITQPALMPTALERGGDFSQSRDAFGRPVQIVDPDDRRAVSWQRDPSGSDQPAGRVAARLLPAAEPRPRRPLQFSSAARHRHPAGRHPVAHHAAAVRPQSDLRQRRVSAHDDRVDQRVRFHRRDHGVGHRYGGQLVAPLLAILLAPAPLSVHPSDHRGHAVFREPHERVGRGRHHRQQSGSGELGSAEPRVRRAAWKGWPARSMRRTATRRTCGRPRARRAAAATTSRLAAASTDSGSTCCRSRTRAERFAFTGATTGSDLADFLLGVSAHQLDCVRQCRQVPPRVRRTRRTSPTTGG